MAISSTGASDVASPESAASMERLNMTLRDALLAQKAGDTQRAISLYQQILNIDPDHPITLRMLGIMAMEQDYYKEAAHFFERAIKSNRKDPELMLLMGKALGKDSNTQKEALNYLRAALRMNPKLKRAHYHIGHIYLLQNAFEEGMEHLRAELAIDPNDAHTLYTIGHVLKEFGRYEEASPYIRASLALDANAPGWSIPWENGPSANDDPSLSISADPLDRFVCISFPKCGTNFLSDILQIITGRDHYWPSDRSDNISPKTYSKIPNGRFLLGHWLPKPHFVDYLKENGYRVVLQFRDPRDQAVSYYFYQTSVIKDEGNLNYNTFSRLSKEQALSSIISGSSSPSIVLNSQAMMMQQWIQGWQATGLPIIYTRYEDLIHNKAESSRRLARFLGAEIDDNTIEQVLEETAFSAPSKTLIAEKQPDRFKRKGQSGDWQNHFTTDMKSLFKLHAGELLINLGYEDGYDW
uniref:Putative alcohol sulfotransferase n=1 Tax=Magnetococcus massalia (strain MO-1) TaxID=451514 RepID=A0A1S7LFR4_MAGMO|nr:Putative alcohol sulfotransferase [Candidatus Magnetococcus massalia]